MKKICLAIFALSLLACKNNNNNEDSSKASIDTVDFKQKVEFSEKQLKLNDDARKYALTWVEYITAQNEINKLESYTVNEVMNNADAIAQITQSLKNSVPDSLKSVAVEARLNVVNTKAQLLKQYSTKREPVKKDITQTANELHTEFNNLKLQMNEIFLKSLEDFEKELDEFEEQERLAREADSIKSEN
ncbi:hypothetical protein [Christiangramia salexigens]|uniref:Lipoprotein n=1 Tax=Christiangramia salexigens TaxID=1913577 RepID=A0A1L3J739_9FLAO|nr:hypothetical protein [Christiangramia salexigens]APG60962.1 hypothetical protein LPB144_11310 [Christiangramia salexigens]